MVEEPLFFNNNKNQRIFGTRHVPKGKGLFPTVILFHGLKGNKAEGYRKYVRLSRLLCLNGYQVFRFDFRGHGDSYVSFENLVMDDLVEDSRDIFEFVRNHPKVNRKRLAVVSLSMCPGLYIKLNLKDIKAMVLISPAAYPKLAIERGWGIGLRHGRTSKGGFILNPKFWRNLDKYNAFTAIRYTNVPILFIAGDEDNKVWIDEVKELYEAANKPKKLIVIKYADHTFWRREHEEKLYKETLKWLKKHV